MVTYKPMINLPIMEHKYQLIIQMELNLVTLLFLL